MADEYSESGSGVGEAEVTQHFWGQKIAAGGDFQVALAGTELHITSVAASGKGASQLFVITPMCEDEVLVATVGDGKAAPLSALVDLDFFEADESVTLKVVGTADVFIAGTAAVLDVADSDEEGEEEDDEEGEEEDDEEGEEEEEEEEVAPAKPAPKAEAAKPAAVAADATAGGKRKREEDSVAAAKPAAKAARTGSEAGAADAATAAHAKGKTAAAAPAPAAAGAAAGGAGTGSKADPLVPVPGSDGKVLYKEVKVGTGDVAAKGDHVTVKYVGRLALNGKQFDAGNSFKFKLGAGKVIRGWDIGVAGMRVGGKRQLYIHPAFAYGARGAPPTIPPNATLVFDVEIVRVA